MFGLDLLLWQFIAIFVTFVWSGFVRGAFNFGGAALSLPILLLIYPDPLFFLPIIAIHLLFFGFFSIHKRWKTINWKYLRKLFLLLLPTKVVGLIGLLKLPTDILVIIIYSFSLFYALNYLFLRDIIPKSRITDTIMLMFGGYMSGTALTGAPVIVAVTARNVSKQSLRATLFALWAILVCIKLSAMVYTEIPLQWVHHIWLLPAAAIGNFLGSRVHRRLENLSDETYYRTLGLVLLLLGVSGFVYYFLISSF